MKGLLAEPTYFQHSYSWFSDSCVKPAGLYVISVELYVTLIAS